MESRDIGREMEGKRQGMRYSRWKRQKTKHREKREEESKRAET
jgi:hypothetical protein